tara:strand:- start:20 stop:535 length:516 start_codon:yes stop_codon:yes gene_type:complete
VDLDNLKSEYQNVGTERSKPIERLKKMKYTVNHPVLKKIKKQLLFESIIWTLILVVFYDFFDGHLKAFYWNVLLVISILLVLLHNILGFIIVQKPIGDVSLKDSLKKYLSRIKSYSIISIASRVIAIIIFMGFLTSTAVWTVNKLIMIIGFFILTISIQIYMLWASLLIHL